MATLYDMELQESNNFIHCLMYGGESPALKLMEEQAKPGQAMSAELNDPDSEMGKGLKRLKELKVDIASVMKATGLTEQMAKDANTIFSKSPESLNDLSEADKKVVNTYWLKKKSCIVVLLKKGYTHEELFS